MNRSQGVPTSFFQSIYREQPLWEIDRPQKAVLQLIASRQVRGRGLDLGCGTGANAIAMTEAGCEIVGVDVVPTAIRKARRWARTAGVKIPFQVGDARRLSNVKGTFDFIVDSGVFHVFSDRDRKKYVQAVASKLRPNGNLFIIAFSPKEKSQGGPRRVSRREIETTFPKSEGWRLNAALPTVYETTGHPRGAKATLFSLTLLNNPKAAAGRPVGKVARARTGIAAAAAAEFSEMMDPQAIAAAQECPNWCWAACLEMLCKSQGVTFDQEHFVEKVYGRVNGELPCLPSGTLETISAALHGTTQVVNGVTITLSAPFHYGIPTNVKAIIKTIREKRPFIFGHGGHAYVCYGVKWLEQSGRIQITRLELIDPLWKLLPQRPQLTALDVIKANQNPVIWLQIIGTLELIVTKS